mmetsp:Transcript_13869/g.27651  ORF Transcript_13869/g.27651 Transcript_13869/m.27651 type:complete len:266 (-) Transcript_13869:121-918(-)
MKKMGQLGTGKQASLLCLLHLLSLSFESFDVDVLHAGHVDSLDGLRVDLNILQAEEFVDVLDSLVTCVVVVPEVVAFVLGLIWDPDPIDGENQSLGLSSVCVIRVLLTVSFAVRIVHRTGPCLFHRCSSRLKNSRITLEPALDHHIEVRAKFDEHHGRELRLEHLELGSEHIHDGEGADHLVVLLLGLPDLLGKMLEVRHVLLLGGLFTLEDKLEALVQLQEETAHIRVGRLQRTVTVDVVPAARGQVVTSESLAGGWAPAHPDE